MSQPVSAAFTAAEKSDIAQVTQRVYVMRGNYASSAFGATATASSTDGSGNYPPSGAIDGDRTEINIGAPVDADNGVGLASWKSAATPSGGSPVTLTITFNATRQVNYIKLYNLAADPLTDYKIEIVGGSTTLVGGTSGRWSNGGYTGGVDIYDLTLIPMSAVSGTSMVVTIYGTTNTDAANVVSVEAYYKYDATDRCTSIVVDRQRDWKQSNPMAATATMIFSNNDRFFSPSHTPTSAEVTAGYFNSELDVGLGLIVQMGYVNTPINVFVGSIDSIQVSSLNGTCVISARDGMKDVINQTWSTKLKSNIDIGDAIKYLLNIANISNYEMSIDGTGFTVPYFFVYESSLFTTIQQLVQAAAYAQFWFDENGKATFKNLLSSSVSSQTDFVFTPAPSSQFQNRIGSVVDTGGTLVMTGNSLAYAIASQPSTQMNEWRFVASAISGGGGEGAWYAVFASQGTGGTATLPNGYAIAYSAITGRSYFVKISGGTPTFVTSFVDSQAGAGTWTVIRVLNISSVPTFYVYRNSVLVFGPLTDSTYTSCSYFSLVSLCGFSSPSSTIVFSGMAKVSTSLTLTLDGSTNLYYSSATIDQGASLSAEGNLAVGYSPSNAPIIYQTRTSSDGSTWGAWTTVTIDPSTQSGPILSSALRYIQYRFYFLLSGSAPLWSTYYVQTNWVLSGSSASVRAISYDAALCEVTQEISDSLGGDSSIINFIEVIASPTFLSGNNTDVQWTATTGQPAQTVSASNPIVVYTGTTVIQAVIPGGMDTSYMLGTNPAAVAITWGTATGSVAISYIHPTKPIITLTVTGQGTITNLQLIGQAFSGATNPIDITSSDATSQSKYKRRTTQISNIYIPNVAVAQLIVNTQKSLTKSPVKILSGVKILLAPSMQLTDLIQITDYNLDLSSSVNWYTSGITQQIKMNAGGQATISTDLKAINLPAI